MSQASTTSTTRGRSMKCLLLGEVAHTDQPRSNGGSGEASLQLSSSLLAFLDVPMQRTTSLAEVPDHTRRKTCIFDYY
jgi:hypothetical protein